MAIPIHWCRFVLPALLLAVVLPVAAQADPPGRVGRVAELQGQVWQYDVEQGDWIAAVLNRPLTTGDRVATDADGRAALRIGSTSLRLGAGSEIEILQLDDERVRVQLHGGRLALHVRTHDAAREFEIVTEEGRFDPELAGRYRLDRVDATTSVTVWSGQLVFQSPDSAATVIAGQRADIVQLGGRTQYTLVQPVRDAFADEVAAADAAAERGVSTTRYVSPEMTGAESLDAYGRWENDPQYGALWVPRAVVPGWAPYRYGHWAWIRPWGWTWVDDAPWGFAPFHYGRWVYRRNLWCWVPGQWVARPVYAPALVAWVGAPLGGVSVSVNIGPSVGWFPLAPREVFVPPYRVTPNYVRNVNVTQVTNITNVTQIVNSPNTVVQQTNYVNRGVPAAVTVVPVKVVSGRQPVAPARVQLTDPNPAVAGQRRMTLASGSQVTAVAPVPAPPPAKSTGMVPAAAAAPVPAPPVTGAAPSPSAPPQAEAGPPGPTAVPPRPVPPPAKSVPPPQGAAPAPVPAVVAQPPAPAALPPTKAPATRGAPLPPNKARPAEPQVVAPPAPGAAPAPPKGVPPNSAPKAPAGPAPAAPPGAEPAPAKAPAAPPSRKDKDEPREKENPKNERR